MFCRSVSLCLALGVGLAAQEGAVPKPPPAAPAAAEKPFDPPRLRVEPQGKVDLGSLGPRERKAQVYTFTNTSAAPIALRVYDLSPGVTVDGPALLAPIPPQGKASLTLHLDATDWVGPQSRNVRLGTDDPGQGTYFLPVRALVRPDLTVDRERMEFGDVAQHESPQKTFTFMRETGEPLEVRVTSPLPPYLEPELVTERNKVRLSFTLRPERIPPGVLLGFENVTVATNAPMQPRFNLYVGWKVHPSIEASPSRVVILDPGQVSQTIALAARSGKPFQLVSATVEGAGFQVDPPAAAAVAKLTLTVRRTAQAATRALLVLVFQGEAAPLKIPLAYLPSIPPTQPPAAPIAQP